MRRSILGNGRCWLWAAGWALLGIAAGSRPASAYTPKSEDVQRAVGRAIQFLEKNYREDNRPGALALAGIALLKQGAHPSHPTVVRVADYLEKTIERYEDTAKMNLDIYSASLCTIFFAILDPNRYGPEVETLLAYLQSKQKPHGGWGYDVKTTGDTSMTQNAVLSFWEVTQSGFRVPGDMLDRALIWLLKTQDPNGGFGYQGVISDDFTPVRQSLVKPSMAGAGLGSVYICAELLNVGKPPKKEEDGLPQALREINAKEEPPHKSHVNPELVHQALGRGKLWMDNPPVKQPDYQLYTLYTLERYYSFREMAEGKIEQEPRWYNDGVRYLLENQDPDGSWTDNCGKVAATAFGVLFLVRSTKQSIGHRQSFGDGTLMGSRGLPKNLAALVLRDGKVVSKIELKALDQMLANLDDIEMESVDYDAALSALDDLPSEKLEPLVSKYAKRLQELAGDKSAAARLTAVRALGRQRNLDNVPVLIYALTDPDVVVMREARDSLRRVSRRFAGFGLPDSPTDAQRYAAIEKWRSWYRAIRPDAEFED